MNKALFWQLLKLKRWSWIIYSAASVALLLLYLPLYPAVRDQAQALTKLMQSLPPGLLKAFGISAESFNNLAAFITREQFAFIWPIYTMFLALSYAGLALAGDIELGTLALTLSQPISRLRVYLARYLAGVAGLVGFVSISVGAIIPLAWLFHYSLPSKGVWAMMIFATFWVLAIYSLGFMVSAMVSAKSRMYATLGGALIVMYVINIFSAIEPKFDKFKYVSLFHYFDAGALMVDAHIDRMGLVLMVAIIVVSFGVGLWRFISRDIPI